MSGTEIGSDFAKNIFRSIQEFKPKKIIETGTFLGTGSTATIARSLRKLGIVAKFFSIEVNTKYYIMASRNLEVMGLSDIVTLMNGLSVRRSELPTLKEITEEYVDKKWPHGVYIDHDEQDRADRYYKETCCDESLPDGLLYSCMEIFDFSSDFILLDSAGHLGKLEFDTVIANQKTPCVIALDDIFHVKHFDNYWYVMKHHDKFKLLYSSSERFGHCIAVYYPKGVEDENILGI